MHNWLICDSFPESARLIIKDGGGTITVSSGSCKRTQARRRPTIKDNLHESQGRKYYRKHTVEYTMKRNSPSVLALPCTSTSTNSLLLLLTLPLLSSSLSTLYLRPSSMDDRWDSTAGSSAAEILCTLNLPPKDVSDTECSGDVYGGFKGSRTSGSSLELIASRAQLGKPFQLLVLQTQLEQCATYPSHRMLTAWQSQVTQNRTEHGLRELVWPSQCYLQSYLAV